MTGIHQKLKNGCNLMNLIQSPWISDSENIKPYTVHNKEKDVYDYQNILKDNKTF